MIPNFTRMKKKLSIHNEHEMTKSQMTLLEIANPIELSYHEEDVRDDKTTARVIKRNNDGNG